MGAMMRLRRFLLGWTGKADTIGSAISNAARASPGFLASGQPEVETEDDTKRRRRRKRR